MHSDWTIYKFRDPQGEAARLMAAGHSAQDVARMAPSADLYAIEAFPGNVALNQGLQAIVRLITKCTANTTALGLGWSSGNAYCGVGNSSTAASAAQTGLLGSHLYAALDADYPKRVNQQAQWRSTFSGTVANFTWYEFTVNSTGTNATGRNLNRKVSTKGTKANGESWTLELDVTFS